MTFQDRLQRLMNDRRLQPTALASRLSVSRQTVHNWLNGATPKGEHLEKLCKFFKVDPVWMVYGDSSSAIDQGLLEAAIEAVEDAIKSGGVSLPPSKKAALIASLMRAATKGGKVPDPHLVEEMVKLSR